MVSAGSKLSAPPYINSLAASGSDIPRRASIAASSGVNPASSSPSGISGSARGIIHFLYFISGTRLEFKNIIYQYIIPTGHLDIKWFSHPTRLDRAGWEC